MSISDYIRHLLRTDQLIRLKATGTPKDLASRLDVSERSVYNTIAYMKKYFNCPIAYSRARQTYYYTKKGEMRLAFRKNEMAVEQGQGNAVS